VSAPSGGFRIKRKNPLTGEIVYQVSSIEGFATRGYDEAIKDPVLIDGFCQLFCYVDCIVFCLKSKH
jgi:hypothetical protein